MAGINLIPWADIVPTLKLLFPPRRDRWIRTRLEHAFRQPVGVTSRPDFADADWIASEYAHVLSAVDGLSTLRAIAHRDVATALGREVVPAESPLAGVPAHCRDTDWTRLGKRLGVKLPPLDVPFVPAFGAFVVLVGIGLLVRKFVPHVALKSVSVVFFVVPVVLVGGAARVFGVPPWHVRTQDQLVSHLVIERASALPADHLWTLGEVAEVVTAVTDLPPEGRPLSVRELLLLGAAAAVAVGAGLWIRDLARLL